MYVGIIDYGSGNIRSVFKSFEKAASLVSSKIKIKVINNCEELKELEKIVLPGVGAFADCMKGLKNKPGLLDAIKRKVLEENNPSWGESLSPVEEVGEPIDCDWLSLDWSEIKQLSKRYLICTQ